MARLRLLQQRGRRTREPLTPPRKLPRMLERAWDTARHSVADRAMGKKQQAAGLREPAPEAEIPQAQVQAELEQVPAKDAAPLAKVRAALRDGARERERARATERAQVHFRESRFRVEKTPAATTLRHSRLSRRLHTT